MICVILYKIFAMTIILFSIKYILFLQNISITTRPFLKCFRRMVIFVFIKMHD